MQGAEWGFSWYFSSSGLSMGVEGEAVATGAMEGEEETQA